MKKRHFPKIVLFLSVLLLLLPLASASISYYFMDRMNFPPDESRVHFHNFTFSSGNLTLIKSSAFAFGGYTGSPIVSGNSISWVDSNPDVSVQFNLTSPSSCTEGTRYLSYIYFNGSFVDEFVYVCMPDDQIRDCKIEYGHGDGNYLSEPYISADTMTLFNLFRVWNLGSYLDPDEEANGANVRCYYENYTVRTYGHGEVSYNSTNVIMDFLWNYLIGGYWFRIGVLSQDFTGEPVGNYYNITCDELTYDFEHERVRVPGLDCSLEIRSCDALNISITNVSTDPNKIKVTIKNIEKYSLQDLYFQKIVDGYSEEQHIMWLYVNESAYFYADKSDLYSYTFYFIPSWYQNSFVPQYCGQSFSVTSGPPAVELLWPLTSAVYCVNETVEIDVRVVDDHTVDTVYATITIPDGSTQRFNLTDTDNDDVYTGNFTDTDSRGTYKIELWANDTDGNINNYELGHFTMTICVGGGSTTINYVTNIDDSRHGGDDDIYNYYNISYLNISVVNITQGGQIVLECDGSMISKSLIVELREEDSSACGENIESKTIIASVTNTGQEDLENILVRPIIPDYMKDMIRPKTVLIPLLKSGESRDIEFLFEIDLCTKESPALSSFPIGKFPFIVEASEGNLKAFGDLLVDFSDLKEFTVEVLDDLYYEDELMKVCFIVNNADKDLRSKLEIEFMVYDDENMYLGDFLSSYTAGPDELLIITKEYPLDYIPKTKMYLAQGYLYQNGSLFEPPYLVAEDTDDVELVKSLASLEFPGLVCPVTGFWVFLWLLFAVVVIVLLVRKRSRRKIKSHKCLFIGLSALVIAVLLLIYYLFYCRICCLLFIIFFLLLVPLFCLMRHYYKKHEEYCSVCEERSVTLKGNRKKFRLRLCHIYAPFIRPKVKKEVEEKTVVETDSRIVRITRMKGEVAEHAVKIRPKLHKKIVKKVKKRKR